MYKSYFLKKKTKEMAKDLSVDFVVRNNIITIEINYQTKLKFLARKLEEKIYAKIGRKIDLNFKIALKNKK